MEIITGMSVRSLQYYAIAKRWSSDIEFFRIETSFLHRLLDDYLLRLSDNGKIQRLILAGKALFKLEKDEREAGKLLVTQMKHLELMAEDIIPEDVQNLSVVQVELEYLMTNLTQEFRRVKLEIFDLVGNALKEDGLLPY